MFHPFHRLPMFGFAFLGFLMIGVILAVACWLAFKSGKDGTTKLGGPAGCFMALALMFVAGLGALGCAAIALVNAPGELLRNGPIRKIEAHVHDWKAEHEGADEADEPGEHGERGEAERKGVHFRIEMTGGNAQEISRWFREHTDGDMTVSVTTLAGPDGPRTRVDIELPIPESELREIRRDFERDLPNLKLPNDVRIELKGADD